MISTRPKFKRAVLGLQIDPLDRAALEVATGLAELLKLHLHALFVQDDQFRELAEYPSAREFVLTARNWRAINLDRLLHEEDLAARMAQRMFTEVARARRVPSTFGIVPGPPARTFASVSSASDILMIAEPRAAFAGVTSSFSLLVDAAIQSAAAVLLIPRWVLRRNGPVVAIAGAPDDPAIETATAIATAMQQEMILFEAYEGMSSAARVTAINDRSVPQISAAAARSMSDARHLSELIGDRNESIIVLTRECFYTAGDRTGMHIAESRRVPVLLLEP
jgi:hypothetical protein